jgi:hypothetical protein
MSDENRDEHVEDLDVPESESDEVKGGLLPASQSAQIEQPGAAAGSHFPKISPTGARLSGES